MNAALELMDQLRTALHERDEARAECESLRKQVGMLNINCGTHYEHGRKVGRWLDEAIEQRDEARAELHASNEQMDSIAKALQLEHDDDIEDAITDMVAEMEHARDRIEELRAEVERLEAGYRRSAEFANEEREVLRKERDEARAEVERLSAYVDKTRASRNQAKEERDAALEEVERVSKWRETWAEAYAMLESKVDTERAAAFRRGAEAMREACAQHFQRGGSPSDHALALTVRILPIPEES